MIIRKQFASTIDQIFYGKVKFNGSQVSIPGKAFTLSCEGDGRPSFIFSHSGLKWVQLIVIIWPFTREYIWNHSSSGQLSFNKWTWGENLLEQTEVGRYQFHSFVMDKYLIGFWLTIMLLMGTPTEVNVSSRYQTFFHPLVSNGVI